MGTEVNRILPDGTYEPCWAVFENKYDHFYNMVTLYMQLHNLRTAIMFPEARKRVESNIKVGKMGTIFFEHCGTIYSTVSSVESIQKAKQKRKKLEEEWLKSHKRQHWKTDNI